VWFQEILYGCAFRTCLTLFMTFWTRVIGWESGVLSAWVGLEDGDLQVRFAGVGGQFNVVEQYS
jgi:hypothetical protein